MITALSILGAAGDVTITWDHADPVAVAKARAEVEALAKAGFSFFRVDGTPADPIAAGAGTLVVRKLTADELVGATAESDPAGDAPAIGAEGAAVEPAVEAPADPPKRRGRPPKADRKAIAVRPLAGG